MSKTITVADLGSTGNYEVLSTKNTIAHRIGAIISAEDVTNLISVGFEVNVKAKKEDKE